jgi:hypothetical protein
LPLPGLLDVPTAVDELIDLPISFFSTRSQAPPKI